MKTLLAILLVAGAVFVLALLPTATNPIEAVEPWPAPQRHECQADRYTRDQLGNLGDPCETGIWPELEYALDP